MRTFFDFKNILVVFVVGLFFNACSSGGDVIKNVSPEIVFDKGSALVLSVDYTEIEQVKNVENLFAEFKKLKIWSEADIELKYAEFVDEFNSKFDNLKAFDELFMPLYQSKWRLSVAMDGQDLENNEKGFYLAFKTDKGDLLGQMIDYYFSHEYEEDGKKFSSGVFYFWENINEQIYISQYGDLFFVTDSKKNRDRAVDRIKKDDGFNISDKTGALVNLFVDNQKFDIGLDEYENLSVSLFAEGDGLKFIAKNKGGYLKAEGDGLKLVEAVPGENVALYFESLLAGRWLNIFEGILDEKDMIALEDTAVSFAFSNVDGLYPAVSIYFDVNVGNVEVLKSVDDGFDLFVDDVIKSLDNEFSAVVPDGGVFIKEEINNDKFLLKKVYLDKTKLPEEVLSKYADLLGGDLDGFKFEFYYGYVGQNLYVITLYPDFEAKYMGKKITGDEYYTYAVSKLAAVEGANIFYTNFLQLFDFLDKNTYLLGEENLNFAISDFDYAMARELLEKFQFVVASVEYEGGYEFVELFFGLAIE